jgi:N-succinyl-L-ornithine transcarbamylase
MRQFTSVRDVENVPELIMDALELKADPWRDAQLGARRTLGLVFMNPSLRTRLSTQKAAEQLGMNTMVMNVTGEGWALEFRDGVVMDGTTVEHVRDAAAVLGGYCDIVGLRCFPGLTDREQDYSEQVLAAFMRHAGVPVISLESATRHPLQSLADAITVHEHQRTARPKVVLTWAPHIKALPQAVANSFAEWMLRMPVDLTIAHPKGLELHADFTQGARVVHDQQEALQGAHFVYAKNWSAYEPYAQVHGRDRDWMLTETSMQATDQGRIMHCLPVRRDLELSAGLLDGPRSLVQAQAENRVYAAQAVLRRMLLALPKAPSATRKVP